MRRLVAKSKFAIGYAMAGPGVRQAVADHIARDDLGLRIRALGGSDEHVAEAIALADAKVKAAESTTRHYTFEEAAYEVLEPWMRGDKP